MRRGAEAAARTIGRPRHTKSIVFCLSPWIHDQAWEEDHPSQGLWEKMHFWSYQERFMACTIFIFTFIFISPLSFLFTLNRGFKSTSTLWAETPKCLFAIKLEFSYSKILQMIYLTQADNWNWNYVCWQVRSIVIQFPCPFVVLRWLCIFLSLYCCRIFGAETE